MHAGFTRALAGTVLIVGFLLGLGVDRAQAQHEGHNHGDAAPMPSVSMDDLRPRAIAAGSSFEFVAMPVSGALAIFLDNADTNEPVLGATVELLTVADEPLVAEEVVPGVYLASPWPPAGVTADVLRGTDVVATVVTAELQDLLVVPLSDELVHATFESGETAGHDDVAKSKPSLGDKLAQLANAENDDGLWLVLIGGLISLAGVSAGIRFKGLGRWVGVSAVAVGLAIGISTTGLV
ncbi:MAG: hypothetical protein NXI03_11855 [Alphaproteobacteria bacterium]|nr:hypothetical protein [Alphaproteobacteria bacterium]